MATGDIIRKPNGESTGEREAYDNYLGMYIPRQIAIGALSAPVTSLPGAYGAIRTTYDWVNDPKAVPVPPDDTSKALKRGEEFPSPLTPIMRGLRAIYDRSQAQGGDNWAEHAIEDKEGVAKLNREVADYIHKTYPNMTVEEKERKYDDIIKHDPKYFDRLTELTRSGVAFNRRWDKKIMNTLGDPRIPTERTQGDTLLNNIGAATPVPTNFAKAMVPGFVMSGLQRINGTTAGNIALNTAEILTPLTFNPSVGRFAANIGVGETADQGFRIGHGNPSVIQDGIGALKQNLSFPEGTSDSSKTLAATGVAGVGATVATVLAWKAGGAATRYITKMPGPKGAIVEGNNQVDQSRFNMPVDNPVREKLANLGDDLGAPTVALRSAGLDDDTLMRVRQTWEQNTGAMPMQAHDNLIEQGLTYRGTHIIPPRQVANQFAMEAPELQETVNRVIAYRNRLVDAENALKLTADDIAETQRKINRLSTEAPNSTEIINARLRLSSLDEELRARQADIDPNLRSSLQNVSDVDARAYVDQHYNTPAVKRYVDYVGNFYKSLIDDQLAAKLISRREATNLKNAVDRGYTHMEDNPLGGKNLYQRLMTKKKSISDPVKAELDTNAFSAYYRGTSERNPRKGYINSRGDIREFRAFPGSMPEPRVNVPYDTFTQMNIQALRVSQAIDYNRAKMAYGDAMMGAPGNQGRKYGDIVFRKPVDQIYSHAKEIDDLLNSKSRPFHISYMQNGDFIVFRVNSSTVKEAMNFAPQAVVPVLDSFRRIIQTINTGSLNPAFTMVSVPWDVMTGVMFRNPNLVFGPISRGAAALFGRGSAMHRLFSTIGSPVDMLYLLARMPDTMIKRMLIEGFGPMTESLGRAMQQSLASQGGVFGTMARLPGGGLILNRIADGMATSYHNSWVYAMKEMGSGHTNMIGQLRDLSKQMDNFGKKNVIGEMQGVWEGYKSILSAVHDSAKELFLSQNQKAFARELGVARRNLPKEVKDFINNETRKIGGDFQRHSGNAWVSRTVSTMPYANVMIQSLRYIKQRMQKYPADTMGKIILGGVLPAAYLYKFISGDEKARDYFFNQIPNDRRMQTLPLPMPAYVKRRMDGDPNAFQGPQDIFMLRMAPEMMLLVNPVLNMMHSLGLFNTPLGEAVGLKDPIQGSRVPISITRDLNSALDNVFGLSLPPINMLAAASGTQFKMGNVFRGDNVFQPLPAPRGQGSNKDKMAPNSIFPKTLYDTLYAAVGTTAGAAMSAINVGTETVQRNQGWKKATKDAMDTFLIQKGAGLPNANILFPDVARRYIYTPVNEELTKNMRVLTAMDQQWSAERALRATQSSRMNRMDRATNPMAAQAAPVDSPTLRGIIVDVHRSLMTGQFKKLGDARADLRFQHENLQKGTAATGTPIQRFRQAQNMALQIQRMDNQRYDMYKATWSRIENQYGRRFLQEFGQPLSPQSLLEAVQMSSRRAGLAQRPPGTAQRPNASY